MKYHSASKPSGEEQNTKFRLGSIVRKLRLGIVLALALAAGLFASPASHGAQLLFDRGSALPGDVIVAGTGVFGGTAEVNFFQIATTVSGPRTFIPAVDNNGTTVRFQIPFGTPPGQTTIALYKSTVDGTPVASGGFEILASIPPFITSLDQAEGTNCVEFLYVITAINNPTNITATPLPPGLSLNISNLGVVSISGVPTESGIFDVPVTAKGEHPTTTMGTLTLTLHPKPPTITSALGILGTNGVSFDYQITTDNLATNFTAHNLSAIVPGLTLDAESGLISGTPTITGTVNINIGAENGPFSDSKTLTIVLDPPQPEITSSLTVSGRKGDSFNYLIEASNNPTSYAASPLPPGLTLSGGQITGIPSVAGEYSITITVSNAGGTDQEILALNVLPRAPVIDSPLMASGVDGSPFNYQITALNDPTSFSTGTRPDWMDIDEDTGELTGIPTSAGQFVVSLSASNPGGTGIRDLTVTIAPAIPVISSESMATATRGVAFEFQITADNAPNSFTATGLPIGLGIAPSSGLITGTPTTLGVSTVSLTAVNETGTGMADLEITVVDPIPAITSADNSSGNRDVDFSYQIEASNDPTSYAVVGSLPPGVSVHAESGLISGRPTMAGVFAVTIQAINSGGTGALGLVITIAEKVPGITSPTTAGATGGSLFTYSIEAGNNPTSYDIAKGAATWLTVNPETGQVSGIAPILPFIVQQQIQLLAINDGGTGTATLTITITPATPVISSAATAEGTANSGFQYQIEASNLPTEYQIAGFPAGYSVDMDSGLITGSPTGQASFTGQIFAGNAGGTGFATLAVTIHRPVPAITSPLTASGVNGTAFSYQITATQAPELFGVSFAPPGLTFTPETGLLSGIPTQSGVFQILISAEHVGGSGQASLQLQIDDPPPPVINSALEATASAGSTFNYQIMASNSPNGFNAASLPLDLIVNGQTGVIEGVPLKPGIYEIKLTASNLGGTGEATLRLTVWSNDGKPPVGVFPTAGNQLRILWPAAATGFVLQSTPDLTPPVMWTDVVATPSDDGGSKELMIDASNGGLYYRLLQSAP